MPDIEALLAALTLEEKAALTAGEDAFSTVGVERLGIPKVHVTDGPAGARGASYPGIGGPPTTCVPCGTAMGATWDPTLVEQLGALLGRNALERGCRGLLAPTVNLHRSPLAGRTFECYSEDPLLTGHLAAGYIRGVQSNGVFATVKHFVGNDAEFERTSINAVIDERALRELYLVPFEMAVRDGGAAALMTSYNRLNGRWVTEQPELLSGILRDEWGFEGLVMTDWFAVVDTATSLAAGLDLEMPGPARSLGPHVAKAIADGTVPAADLDAAVRRLLGGLDRIGALDGAPPPVEPAPPAMEDRALLRRAAAEATVLLHNDGVLPLEAGSLRRVAVLGPRAADPAIFGGGSARVIPHTVVSPLETLTAALGDGVEVVHERGCEADRAPTLVGALVLRARDGFEAVRYSGRSFTGEAVDRQQLDTLRLLTLDELADDGSADDWSLRVHGTVVPDESGVYRLALAQSGRARLFVDGDLVLDGFTDPPPPGGSDFFGRASQDIVADVRLERGVPVEVVLEYATTEADDAGAIAGRRIAGFRVGFRNVDVEGMLDRAAEAAAAADVAIVFVGTSHEWETEGHDRTSLALPGRQDELIRRVAAANRRTVVVVNAGAPVEMAWSDDVAAVLQCWFGGEGMAAALADVLIGVVEPGGRLPTTIPLRLEHVPSHDNFPGENGEVRYGEGLFMGNRGYEHRGIEPRFCFGHGLGYTTFVIGEPALSSDSFRPGDTLVLSVAVTNTGARAGSEVVQCYVAPDAPRLARPPKELKAFAKVHLEPGETTTVELMLDDRAFAYWDPGQADWPDVEARLHSLGDLGYESQERREPRWQVDPGRYELLLGRSSQDIAARCPVRVVRGT
jgi:beta-glucosidase